MATRDLLPNYLKEPAWLDLADAIDSVFGEEITPAMKCLQYIRYLYIPSDAVSTKVANREMVDFADFDMPERSVAVQQTNLLGLGASTPSGMTQADFVKLTRNLGGFWYSKGTSDFIDFVGFCLNTDVSMANLWTNDYVSFYQEGDPVIGTPVWQGGSWYPTTHVSLTWDSGRYTVPLTNLIALFYDIANYNLVIHDITTSLFIWIAERGDPFRYYPDQMPSHIVNMALMVKTVVNIKNY